MKRIAVACFVITALFCLSETNFAQKKKRTKKIVSPSITATTGVKKPCTEESSDPYGYPVSTIPSSGVGTGGGSGAGNGNGNGSGGVVSAPPAPPKIPCDEKTVKKSAGVNGPTEPLRIISKPVPPYTTEARNNQVTGNVTLRIVFKADGTIGGVAPVSGLPYGLTEQAMAAARSIRFEPAKRNGVAVTTTKMVIYNFTIY